MKTVLVQGLTTDSADFQKPVIELQALSAMTTLDESYSDTRSQDKSFFNFDLSQLRIWHYRVSRYFFS